MKGDDYKRHNYAKKIQTIVNERQLESSIYDAIILHDDWCALLGDKSDKSVYCDCDPEIQLTKRGTMH